MKTPTMPPPGAWRPASFSELIGPAGEVGAVIEDKVDRMNATACSARWAFNGPPGTGKSSLAVFAALGLARGESLNVETKSGVLVTVDVVKGWMGCLGMGSLFSGRSVKLIHELDRVTPAAQDLLLDYLDRIQDQPDLAFIGSSNTEIDKLQERFQTRLQFFPVQGPGQEDIEALLCRWPVPAETARLIAAGACGNVRAALLDLESHLDVEYSRTKRGRTAA
jgi:replication-associated recombination protein RarA